MANNVDLAALTGTCATDDVSAVHYQVVKLATGVEDSATRMGSLVDTAAGGTDAGMPMLVVRDDALAALTPVEGDYVPLRVDANGALWAVLSGTVTLGAGSAAIGKLAANSGVDIGDVDVTSLPALAAGTALIGKVSIDQVTASANEVVTKTGSVTTATLSAETTKVIGTVNIAAAQTLATVTTVGAVTAITNALPAGTNNIGDVDVLTVPADPFGVNADVRSLGGVPGRPLGPGGRGAGHPRRRP
jgi:hypothetical protein